MVALTARLAMLAVVFGTAMPACAYAEDYPSRPITLVVGMAPGSVQDATARVVARRAAQLLGSPIVVENKPGAATMNATAAVVKSMPDGYTLLQNGVALSVNPHLYKRVPYEASTDLVPVAYLVNAPQILVVNPELGVRTLAEFLAKFRDTNTLNFASPGVGTTPHLAAELLRNRSGIKMNHVPYRGGGPALTDVIAGHVQLTFLTPVAEGHIRSGEVTALAVAAEERLESLPEIPTFAEAGLPLPEINAGAWFGILAPKGMPAAIVTKLNATFNTVLRDEGTQKELKALGLVPKPMSPAEFADFMRDNAKMWQSIVSSVGIERQ